MVKKNVTEKIPDPVESVLFKEDPATAYSDNKSCPVSAASTLPLNSLGAPVARHTKAEKARIRQ